MGYPQPAFPSQAKNDAFEKALYELDHGPGNKPERYDAFMKTMYEIHNLHDRRKGREFPDSPGKLKITLGLLIGIVIALALVVVLVPVLLVAGWFVLDLMGRWGDFLARLVGLLP